jgi:alkanesulfonate monooxygenase SsuD/methylene tetrahydromethanopterin reductase-like flavin-dependent oxidoreductase (luciferase family)
MEFGTWIINDPRQVAEEAKFAEEHGFTHGWVADLPLDFGDVFVCLTLAAAATRTLKLGSWVAAAPFRVPPASVSAIASIHAIAPGRIIFGVGTGSYGRAVMACLRSKSRIFTVG